MWAEDDVGKIEGDRQGNRRDLIVDYVMSQHKRDWSDVSPGKIGTSEQL